MWFYGEINHVYTNTRFLPFCIVERGGLMIEHRTPEQEVGDSNLPTPCLCP